MATTGTACFSVHSRRRASAILRVVMPMITTATASATAASAVRRKPLRDTAGAASFAGAVDLSGAISCSGDMVCSSDRGGCYFALSLVQEAEDDRHEHTGRRSRQDKPATHTA